MKDGVSAASTLAATNTVSAAAKIRRRSTRASTTPATGAATATVAEKTVTSCPATPSETSRSAAISGRTPAMT
jgi:alcohol dehydrogenase YqhD (iron-dependent ADH family)